MALFQFSRLCGKSVLSTVGRVPTVLGSAQYAQAAAGVPKISFKKFEPPQSEHYDIKNERLHRPLSPHLTIYQPQLTSMLSITHRFAGMILTGYATALGFGALVLPNDVSSYVAMIEGLSAPSLFILKAAIALPFSYHFANGIRHLAGSSASSATIGSAASAGTMALKAVDFEVFGRVQGVFFRKYTKQEADKLGLKGWCLNTSKGTVLGHVQGPAEKVETMMQWLRTKGSPSSQIDKAEFRNEKNIDSYTFESFDIRKDV